MANVMPDTLLSRFAGTLGASEPALRLLISILIGYPLALLHRHTLYGKYPALQHLFFIASGLGIGYFNYGTDVVHSLVCVACSYFLLLFAGGTVASLIISFVFNMTYLLLGYYFTETESYDIKWSMPHCVLTLRLIGLTFDVYDGCRNKDTLSGDQKKTALTSCPSIWEIGGHTYFFGGFMIGPQFPMRRYLDFVHGSFTDSQKGELPACLNAALLRGGMGCLYLLLFQVVAVFLPDDYLLSESYMERPIYQRLVLLGIWGKIVLYKYIACWLIAEGTCIMTGLTYNGKDDKGVNLWDGCANVKIRKFEGAVKFGELIQSFNTNTNRWIAQYVFKRARFLGNKLLSQGLSLLFLAVWHGLHSGYYMCFVTEFTVMKFESDLGVIISWFPAVDGFLKNPTIRIVKWIVLKIYVVIFMGYCLIPFVLLSFNKWWIAYQSVYFAGHVLWVGWIVLSPLVTPALKRMATPPKPPKKAE